MASPPTDDEAERPSNQDTISKIGFHYMGFWRNSLQFLRVFRNQYPKNGPKLILSRATWANKERRRLVSHKEILIDPPVLHEFIRTNPDLAEIASAWPSLSEGVRAELVAMVRGTSKRT